MLIMLLRLSFSSRNRIKVYKLKAYKLRPKSAPQNRPPARVPERMQRVQLLRAAVAAADVLVDHPDPPSSPSPAANLSVHSPPGSEHLYSGRAGVRSRRQDCQMVCFQMVYFMAIWYNLWPFGKVCGNLVYFSQYGIFGPRKIWQPWPWTIKLKG
jgi:hypothetical protein